MDLMTDDLAISTSPHPTVAPTLDDPPVIRRPVTIIEPVQGWQWIDVRELWMFRELLVSLIVRDVKVRYKQTVLGAAWAVLQPAMMMVVFTVFFGRMARVPTDGTPYPLFAYAGLLPWTFFATAIANAGTSVVGSERLITKVYFPRLVVPFGAIGAAVVDFAIAFALLLAMMIFYGVAPGPGLLLVPVIFALITMAALGIGTLLAALNVAYRDFRYIIPFLVQLGMFATPTIYMKPDPNGAGPLQALLMLNPMTPLIGAFRAAVLGQPITWGPVLIASGIVLITFPLGCLYYRKVEDSFADII